MSAKQQHDAWVESLEEGLANVRAGQTFRQAFGQIPVLKGSPQDAGRWSVLRERIMSGSLSAEAGLEALLREQKLRRRTQRLMDRKTALPRLQANVLTGLSVLLLGASFFMFPKSMRPQGLELGLAFVGLSGAHFWMHALLRHFKRRLWELDWLLLLARVEAGLGWGLGPAAAWHQAWEELEHRPWPVFLRAEMEAWIQSLRRGQDWKASAPPKRSKAALRRCLKQLDRLASRHAQGLSLRELLQAYVQGGWEEVEGRVDIEGERLSLQMLLPLFVGMAPALLAPMWGPLLRSFAMLK